MDRNIVEILVILLREHPEGIIQSEDFEPLSQNLFGQGYTQHEIETALFWFNNRFEMQNRMSVREVLSPDSFRVLQDVEKTVITTKAYGYLLDIVNLGLINLDELDAIIEKAVLLGGRKVDVDEIKMFIAAQIMEQENELPSPGLSYYLKTPPNRIQ